MAIGSVDVVVDVWRLLDTVDNSATCTPRFDLINMPPCTERKRNEHTYSRMTSAQPYGHTDKQTDRQTDRQTYRQTYRCRQTDGWTGRQTNRHRNIIQFGLHIQCSCGETSMLPITTCSGPQLKFRSNT